MPADPAFAPVPAEPDHVALEHRVLEHWDRDGTFERLRKQNEGGPTFSFIDGPITANNPMGVHHAWGRSLKDLFQRYHAALGEDQRYQNGFDCQGLWVEVEVEKALGLNSKHEIEAYGLDRFARACRDRVAEYSGVQTAQSRRLGMWMDWERSYFTMTDPNISYIWGFLKLCHDRGWLYQGHRPMVWCLRCGTSLSQHEVTATDSYRDIVDPSLYVRFRFSDAPRRGAGRLDDDAVDAAGQCHRGGQARCRVRLGGRRRRAPRRGQGSLQRGLRAGREHRRQRARRRADRTPLRHRLRRPAGAGRGHPPGRRRSRRRHGRGHGDRPHRARLWRRGLRDRQARGAGRARARRRSRALRRGLRRAHGPQRARGARPRRRAPRARRLAPAPGAPRAPLSALLALRHEADLPRRRRVVHPLRRDPPADDRRQQHGRVDALALRQAHGGLAAQHGRLVHLAQALLGPAAAVLVLPGRAHERRRLARGTARASHRGPRGAAGAAPAMDRPRHDRLRRVRGRGRARARGGRLLARRRHRPVLDARLRPRHLRARGLRGRRGRGADEGRPARPRLLGEVVPGRLDLGDARADPPVVLLPAVHVGGARRARSLRARARLREAPRRARPGDAQVMGQRDLVRRRDREDRRRRQPLDVRRPGPRAEHELRLRPGQ